VDLAVLHQRVGLVETSLTNTVGPAADRTRSLCVHELDRLAESLVGEPAAEAQEVKNRIQRLLARLPRSARMPWLTSRCTARGFAGKAASAAVTGARVGE